MEAIHGSGNTSTLVFWDGGECCALQLPQNIYWWKLCYVFPRHPTGQAPCSKGSAVVGRGHCLHLVVLGVNSYSHHVYQNLKNHTCVAVCNYCNNCIFIRKKINLKLNRADNDIYIKKWIGRSWMTPSSYIMPQALALCLWIITTLFWLFSVSRHP